MFSPERQEPAVRLTAYLPIPAIRMASYRVLFRSPNDPNQSVVESTFLLRISLLIVTTFLFACESSAGGDHPDCDISRQSQVSFAGPDSEDQLVITIQGSPCYEASLAVSIESATGTRLYEYEARFKPHVAVHWEDSSLNEDAERLADRFIEPESFSLTSDLPRWLPEADYYEAHYQIIQISREDYEALLLKDCEIPTDA
jgi:hypothetical protein